MSKVEIEASPARGVLSRPAHQRLTHTIGQQIALAPPIPIESEYAILRA